MAPCPAEEQPPRAARRPALIWPPVPARIRAAGVKAPPRRCAVSALIAAACAQLVLFSDHCCQVCNRCAPAGPLLPLQSTCCPPACRYASCGSCRVACRRACCGRPRGGGTPSPSWRVGGAEGRAGRFAPARGACTHAHEAAGWLRTAGKRVLRSRDLCACTFAFASPLQPCSCRRLVQHAPGAVQQPASPPRPLLQLCSLSKLPGVPALDRV